MRITVVLGIVGLASLFSRSSLAADGTSDPDGLPTAPSWLDHVGYQVETGAASTYVFRGRAQYVSRDDASLQSTVALTGKGFGPGDVTLTAWNAQALSARPQAGNASEVDLTPSYTLTIADKWSVSAGYMAYVYAEHLPSQPLDGAHEVFGSLSFLNAWVTPSVGVYAEFVRLDGVYATAGLSRTFTLGPIDVTPQASVGWAAYKGVASRLNDGRGAMGLLRALLRQCPRRLLLHGRACLRRAGARRLVQRAFGSVGHARGRREDVMRAAFAAGSAEREAGSDRRPSGRPWLGRRSP
jgi:hypothetical protein